MGCAKPKVAALACAIGLAACASAPPASPRDVADSNDTGRSVNARSNIEKEVLKAIPSLASSKPQQVAGATVVAEPAYVAASGRTCRALSINAQSKADRGHRLACTNGGAWFFVPDVFGLETSQN
jgi:hypothetical protein